ncbi:MAG: CoA transferase [Betaproteobacteria bacterium]|nr:MAG: CoA transferase [Betaproteobacteria bacterium]
MNGKADTLAGLKVLDFSIFMAGPVCSRLLADAGAEVVKVEPFAGDMVRQRPPMRGSMSTYFAQMNCGKRSIVLDLKTREGVEAARALALKADVVLENFKPGVMKRLGLDYETLARANPRLIYCSISGFGQNGPLAARPAYAPVIHAFSGYDLAHMEHQGGEGKPAKTGLFIADVVGALHAQAAILTALLHRERSGKGQYIDVSLLDGMLGLMVYEMQLAQFPRDEPRLLYTPLAARDGFVMIAAISPKNFEALCDALAHPEWKTDSRFSSVKAREQNWDELMRLLEDWTRLHSAQECEDKLLAADVPCSRYRSIGEAMADPHLAARGSLERLGSGDATYLVANPPYQMSQSRTHARPLVPELGEHTDAVLKSWLGLDGAGIAKLRAARAIPAGMPE